MNTCPGKNNNEYHQFFAMPNQRVSPEKVRTVCVFCGQVRAIWANGQIEITRSKGEITVSETVPTYNAP